MLLKVDCLPNAVGKQPSIPLIYLGKKWTLNWWWWWWWWWWWSVRSWNISRLTSVHRSQIMKAPIVASSWLSWMSMLMTCAGSGSFFSLCLKICQSYILIMIIILRFVCASVQWCQLNYKKSKNFSLRKDKYLTTAKSEERIWGPDSRIWGPDSRKRSRWSMRFKAISFEGTFE